MNLHLRAALLGAALSLLAPAAALAIPPGDTDPCDRPRPPRYCGDPEPPPPTDHAPIGHLDSVTVEGGKLRVSGWSIDPDTSGPNQVQILLDGKLRQTVTAS